MESIGLDDYNLKTDIGYKFLLNWCLKKIAESFMVDNPLYAQNLRNIYSRIEFMINFFPYFNEPDALYSKTKKQVIFNGKIIELKGLTSIKQLGVIERQDLYYAMLGILRKIMNQMDRKKLLLQSYASVVFQYDGDIEDDVT